MTASVSVYRPSFPRFTTPQFELNNKKFTSDEIKVNIWSLKGKLQFRQFQKRSLSKFQLRTPPPPLTLPDTIVGRYYQLSWATKPHVESKGNFSGFFFPVNRGVRPVYSTLKAALTIPNASDRGMKFLQQNKTKSAYHLLKKATLQFMSRCSRHGVLPYVLYKKLKLVLIK